MYSSNSPYSKTPIKGDYLDIMNSKYEMRPDLLSHKLFGSVKYWWVFAVRNPDKIVDPIQDFRAGCVIRIPKLNNIR